MNLPCECDLCGTVVQDAILRFFWRMGPIGFVETKIVWCQTFWSKRHVAIFKANGFTIVYLIDGFSWTLQFTAMIPILTHYGKYVPSCCQSHNESSMNEDLIIKKTFSQRMKSAFLTILVMVYHNLIIFIILFIFIIWNVCSRILNVRNVMILKADALHLLFHHVNIIFWTKDKMITNCHFFREAVLTFT